DTFRDHLFLAVSTFHGNRMDVPRRLRACGLHGAAAETCRPFCNSANTCPAFVFDSTQSGVSRFRTIRVLVFHRCLASERNVPLLWSEVCNSEIRPGGPPSACRFHSLSSVTVCAHDHPPQLGIEDHGC